MLMTPRATKKMKIGLFIPCYIDQFYPQVAIATLQFLEKFECDVEYPVSQVCCGQPMANAGFEHLSRSCSDRFVNTFAAFDYIVCPSGSCTLHIKNHLHNRHEHADAEALPARVYELTEFLVDIIKVKSLSSHFPFRVGMHNGCHGQRGLGLSQPSEIVEAPFSKPLKLLNMVSGIEIVELDRPDECCGFGGTFCVQEEAVSVKMGSDRVDDYTRHGVQVITGSDISCLMHIEGILKRKRSDVRVCHIAEILNQDQQP